MISLFLEQIARATGGVLMDAGAQMLPCRGVSTDSRKIQPGSLFVALRGERFDGHDYLVAAREAGAVAALVDHPCDSGLPEILVSDTRLALGRLARDWRDRVDPLVVAVTGSAGKTTVKQMLAAIFSEQGATLATEGNLNNDIGVPLTLCRLERAHGHAVIEMGANHVGEIAALCRIAAPDIALVTFAGRAHVGEFGSVAAIVEAKGEIYHQLEAGSVAVINLGSPGAARWLADHGRAKPLTFLLDGAPLEPELAGKVEPDVRGSYRLDAQGAGVLEVRAGDRGFELAVPLPGRHNGLNLLAAVTVALAAGLGPQTIARGLMRFEPPTGRLAERVITDRLRLIDDSYNANPESMMAAIDVLAARSGRRLFVMGDMGELGDQAEALHREVGAHAAAMHIDGFYALGDNAWAAVEAFGERGRHFGDHEALIAALGRDLERDEACTVLVKGSRFMKMERVVEALTRSVAGGGK